MVHIVKYEARTSTFFDRDLGNSYIHWFAIFQRFNSLKKKMKPCFTTVFILLNVYNPRLSQMKIQQVPWSNNV